MYQCFLLTKKMIIFSFVLWTNEFSDEKSLKNPNLVN